MLYIIQPIMTDSLTTSALGIISARRRQFLRNNTLIDLLKQCGNAKLRSFRVVNQLVALLQEVPFFYQFSSNFKMLSQVAQKIEYMNFIPGETIYKIKQSSTHFFIILEGEVHLTIPEEIEKPKEEKEEKQYLDQQNIFNDIFDVKEKIQAKQINNNNKQQNEEVKDYVQKIIRVIDKDDCFGQMMGEVSIRATNALAVDECHLLAISKKAYEVLLKAQLRTDNRSKFLFLSSLPIFAPLPTFSLESICLQLSERQMSYGQVLFHEGQQISKIYIVHSGEFKLMKAVSKHSTCAVERRIKGKSQYKCITLPTKQVPFVIVQAGEILGDGQVLSLQYVYQQMCVCQSQTAKIFAIDKRHYFKILTSDKQIFEKIRKIIQQKHKRRKFLTYDFLQRRSRQSQMNTLLNSNEWAIRPKEFIIRDKSVNSSISSLTSEDIIKNDGFFLNELNKTFAQNTKGNRFSINKKKCQTEASDHSKLSPLIKPNKKDGIPHCVQDIVSIVKLKANFLRRFRKQRKRQRNVFKFDKEAVPLFIKSKYNKIQQSKH